MQHQFDAYSFEHTAIAVAKLNPYASDDWHDVLRIMHDCAYCTTKPGYVRCLGFNISTCDNPDNGGLYHRADVDADLILDFLHAQRKIKPGTTTPCPSIDYKESRRRSWNSA